MKESYGGVSMEAPKKIIDTKTGREVLTEHPFGNEGTFKWREGYVLRALPAGSSPMGEMAHIGGDKFEWVPKDEVDIE